MAIRYAHYRLTVYSKERLEQTSLALYNLNIPHWVTITTDENGDEVYQLSTNHMTPELADQLYSNLHMHLVVEGKEVR